MVKASHTGGVKPMSITGRFVSERERLYGMTDAERAFRSQWLKDQILAADEPRPVAEMYKATYNPIRRAYRWPLDKLGEILTPTVGVERAKSIRYYTGKVFLGIAGAYLLTYYVKYNTNDWTRKNGMRILSSRPAVNIGDPGYPSISQKSKGEDYGHRGFQDCKLNL